MSIYFRNYVKIYKFYKKGFTIETLHKPTKRVLDILTYIANTQKGSNLTEISLELNIPKSTISPILKTLLELKFIQQDKENLKYIIGIKSFKVGNSFLDNISIMDVIKSHMRNIVKQCNEICQLGFLEGKDVVYIAKVDPAQPIKLSSSVGKTLPANCTALGKILLSSLSNEELKELYAKGLPSLTKKSINNIETLIKQINDIRKSNFAYETGESNSQIQCLAVPIFNQNKIIASMSVSIPIFRSNKAVFNKIKNILLKESEQISKEINRLDVLL